GVQADVAAMFNFTANGFSWDLGYNFWGRSKEKIHLSDDDAFPENTWALKGDAEVFGFLNNGGTIGAATALSASESKATITTGTNGTVIGNPSIDSPVNAYTDPLHAQLFSGASDFTAPTPIKTSVNPVMITVDDLNV